MYSPIWHPLHPVAKFYSSSFIVQRFGIARYFGIKELYYERFRGGRALIKAAMHWKSCLRYCFEQADLIMPNSRAELADLCSYLDEDFSAAMDRSCIVKNATNLSLQGSHQAPPKEKVVVCAGRVEPRKNQLNVARAFLADKRLSDYRLVFAGAVPNKHKSYFADIQKLNSRRIVFLGHLDREAIRDLFARSSVCILASYFETTGLVGLEAAALGCHVVMTANSYNDEYYGENACYCDPYSLESISEAIFAATRLAEASPPKTDWVTNGGFTWPVAAAHTERGYARIVSRVGSTDN